MVEVYTAWAGPTAACKTAWRKLALEHGGTLPCELSTACLERCLPAGEGAHEGPLARHATPTSQPLFLVFRDGAEVAAVRGANIPVLMDAVRRCVAGDEMPPPPAEQEAHAAPAAELPAVHEPLAPVQEQAAEGGEAEGAEGSGEVEGCVSAGGEPQQEAQGAASSRGTEAQEGSQPVQAQGEGSQVAEAVTAEAAVEEQGAGAEEEVQAQAGDSDTNKQAASGPSDAEADGAAARE